MDLQLKNRRAIVLGGTRGIGAAICERLLAEGAHVTICARSADGVKKFIADHADHRESLQGVAVDIADHRALGTFVADIANSQDGLDILISNASALTSGDAPEMFRECLETDVLGAVTAVNAARDGLRKAAKEKGDAAIVAISSVAALTARGPSAYGAVKAALIHYIAGVARAEACHGVRANCVSPGTIYFKGGMWHRVEKHMPDLFQQTTARNPTGRLGSPEEVAASTVFLASPLSGFTTGSNLVVDGKIAEGVQY